jgi:hypothetical protein
VVGYSGYFRGIWADGATAQLLYPYSLKLKLQPVFAKARKYLDISKRLDVLNRKMDILKARQHALFPNSIGTVASVVLRSCAARVVCA